MRPKKEVLEPKDCCPTHDESVACSDDFIESANVGVQPTNASEAYSATDHEIYNGEQDLISHISWTPSWDETG